MSKLIPNTLLEAIPNLYETENVKDPICHIKLFTPDSNWTWYIIEISKEDKNLCFGYVIGHESELGYFNLDELESVRSVLGLPVERDLHFTPTLLSVVKRGN
ncbi:DUF2958 domain-containing protein [Sulfurimonas gotlandica]|uniref:DUF2958 domain-containing protein n=1 Tax=Sulfurimonas gotlandica TaxID=1176482 RepID=UPI0005870979|nr:DUF2958 domain-containing protein [Sulfurimonas gotlandica]